MSTLSTFLDWFENKNPDEKPTVIKSDLTEQEKLWNKFSQNFFGLFFAHIVLKAFTTVGGEAILLFLGLNLLVTLLMVANVGWYSYLFSSKRIFLLKGVLGFFWLGLLFIFIAYLSVKIDYLKSRNLAVPLITKIIFWIGVVLFVLVAGNFLFSLM